MEYLNLSSNLPLLFSFSYNSLTVFAKLKLFSIRTHPLLQGTQEQWLTPMQILVTTKYGSHDAEHVPHVGVVLKSHRYFYS